MKPKESFDRKKIQRDKFEKNKEFAQKIVHTYRTLAKELGWEIVNASQTKSQVHKNVIDVVLRYLK